jgi:hypothetical protein
MGVEVVLNIGLGSYSARGSSQRIPWRSVKAHKPRLQLLLQWTNARGFVHQHAGLLDRSK